MKLNSLNLLSFLTFILTTFLIAISTGLLWGLAQTADTSLLPIYCALGPDDQPLFFLLVWSLVYLFTGLLYWSWVKKQERRQRFNYHLLPSWREKFRATLFGRRLLLVAVLLFVAYFTFYFDLLFTGASERFSGSRQLNSLLSFLALGLLGYSLSLPQRAKSHVLAETMFFLSASIYFFINSSRGLAIAPIIVALMAFRARKIFQGLIWLGVAVLALVFAFETRSYAHLGLVEKLEAFFVVGGTNSIGLSEHASYVFSRSFAGRCTLDVVWLSDEWGHWSVAKFLVWMLPIPSWLLDVKALAFSSLNDLLGVSKARLGINSDIFSEAYWRFGFLGSILVPVYISSLIAFSYLYLSRFRNGVLLGAWWFTGLYIFLGGNVMSIRAATRPMVYLLLVVFLVEMIRRLLRSRQFSK